MPGEARHHHRRLDERPARGLMLRRAGWDVDIYERVDSELSGRGAGIVAQPELIERLRALGLATDALGVAITTRKILDARGPRSPSSSNARRCSPPGSASTGCCATPFRRSTITAGAGLRGFEPARRCGDGAFFRRRDDRGRSAGRRRRHPLDRAPASAARGRAALRRLLRLARADRGRARFRPTSIASCSST